MDVRTALEWGRRKLEKKRSCFFSRQEEFLLEEATGRGISELYTDYSGEIGEKALRKFSGLIEKRLRGIPPQYIAGRCEFMSLEFMVDGRVFIPRPETEVAVEQALRFAGECDRVIDIGTGSGNIAVSLAHYAGCRVYASDVSRPALDVARQNARLNAAEGKIKFFEGDMFFPFREMEGGKFDMIISNPPYVRAGDIDGLQYEISRYEPATALDGGEDGLGYYRVIVSGAGDFLKSGGFLILEVGRGQARPVMDMLGGRFFDGEAVRDYAGIERVIVARKEKEIHG